MAAPVGREFFTVRTVAEALAEFRPAHRTAPETVGLASAFGRVPAEPVVAGEALPGFHRSAVDGFAVRAADTFGASESVPAYLRVTGEVRMGATAEGSVGAGDAVSVPTGGALPAGADAVVMVEHTLEALPGTIEVVRPVAPGEGVVRADEDVAAGDVLARPGRPLRAEDVAMLAAAGVTEVAVHARPRVTIVATGDEIVPPSTVSVPAGYVRDALSTSVGALVVSAGGVPAGPGGEGRAGGGPAGGGGLIVPDDPEQLRAVLLEALPRSDVLVVCAGSSVGARDGTTAAVSALPDCELWCHGLAIKPGKPTLLATAGGGRPVIGLPGNPRSALVVFRLIGLALVRRAGGWTAEPRVATVPARLARDLPSAAGRLDVVQVRLGDDGLAEPLFGPSALLSVLTAADGYLIVDEDANGLSAGDAVQVVPYG